MTEPIPASLLAALADLGKWLDDNAVKVVVIGGVASSILGRPRLTRDLDALTIIPESDWARTLSSAANYGIIPRIDDPIGFALRSRMLLLKHTASSIDIDLALGGLAFEVEALKLSRLHEVGGVSLRLPRVEDLLVMKAFAHRPKDMEDIDGLLAVHPIVDLGYVRQWLREFSTAVSKPDLLEDFEKVVARRSGSPDK